MFSKIRGRAVVPSLGGGGLTAFSESRNQLASSAASPEDVFFALSYAEAESGIDI
jgi:hypothetical protein